MAFSLFPIAHINKSHQLGSTEDKKQSRTIFESLAGKGHAEAQHTLGVVRLDESPAAAIIELLRRAASKGHANANTQYDLCF